MPRINRFLPTGTILEIAPGGGRWTQFLNRFCDRLIGVDLSPVCIDICQRRFSADPRREFHVNDGCSLEMVKDRSIDFVFCFDSLVHAEADAVDGYLRQLVRKLTPDGAGFIHHSNLGDCQRPFMEKFLPERVKELFIRRGYLESSHLRAPSMTARRFEESCTAAGLQCISQELINWRGSRLIDCLSTFTLPGSRWAQPNQRRANTKFMSEAAAIASYARLYHGSGP